jgi:ABC-type phosphate transport system auxiliary subunit
VALHSKAHHLLEHLKMEKKDLKKCQVSKKLLQDELSTLKAEHERTKAIAEKLQGKVTSHNTITTLVTLLWYSHSIIIALK